MEFLNENKFKNNKGIYIITNNINDKVYIGQTRQRFIKRYWHHLWKLKNNSHDNIHLQNAFNLYGSSSFTFEIIESVEDNNKLDEIEVKYISYYRELDRCYNIQSGGQVVPNYERTLEQRKSIGEKNRIHMTGRTHTEETKLKMSESRMGMHVNRDKYILNEELAFVIKSRLIEGIKPKDISSNLNIDYKLVNGILSNNTWKHVHVDGWDDFRNTRPKTTRLTKEQMLDVYNLYLTGDYTYQDLAEMYGKTKEAIYYIIRKLK